MKRVFILLCVCLFLFTIQRREISLIIARAAKFCIKTKEDDFYKAEFCYFIKNKNKKKKKNSKFVIIL